MSQDVLTTYEALFKQAQWDLRTAGLYEFEKDAGLWDDLLGVGRVAKKNIGGAFEGAGDLARFGDEPVELADAYKALQKEAPAFRARAHPEGETVLDFGSGAKKTNTGPEPRVAPTPEAKKKPAPKEPVDIDGDGIPDEEKGRGWLSSLGTLGAVGTGVGGLGGGGYLLGKSTAEDEADRRRNLAFGAGMATGVAAPRVLQGIGGRMQDLGAQMGQGMGPAPGGYY